MVWTASSFRVNNNFRILFKFRNSIYLGLHRLSLGGVCGQSLVCLAAAYASIPSLCKAPRFPLLLDCCGQEEHCQQHIIRRSHNSTFDRRILIRIFENFYILCGISNFYVLYELEVLITNYLFIRITYDLLMIFNWVRHFGAWPDSVMVLLSLKRCFG